MKYLLILLFALATLCSFAQSGEIVTVGPSGSSNQPLYIIDSVITTNFSNVNPNDIISISVLKGAQAIAAYGENAKNGVIIVTTIKSVQKNIDQKLNNFSKDYKRFKEIEPDLKIAFMINDKDSNEQAVYNLPAEQILSVKFNNNRKKPIAKITTKP